MGSEFDVAIEWKTDFMIGKNFRRCKENENTYLGNWVLKSQVRYAHIHFVSCRYTL